MKLSAAASGSVSPGDTPSYTAVVTNMGGAAVSGVNLRVQLPAGFRYKSTSDVVNDGAARTQAGDPEINSQTPLFGLWTLDAPTENADGSVHRANVAITFVVSAGGGPGTYQMRPLVSSDASDTVQSGASLAVSMGSAPQLSIVAGVLTPVVSPGSDALYQVTVTNTGTAPSPGVAVLFTIPGNFGFDGTTKIGGNAARSGGGDPTQGSSLVLYTGFTIPAASQAGPGLLAITFKALCEPGASSGSYPSSVQLTDALGNSSTVAGQGSLTVVGGSTPTPVPSPTRSPGPSVPARTPTPSATP